MMRNLIAFVCLCNKRLGKVFLAESVCKDILNLIMILVFSKDLPVYIVVKINEGHSMLPCK